MSTSLSGNSIGSAIDTSGYVATVWQLSGVWQGSVRVESSNDGNAWDSVLALPSDSPILIDVITDNGIYVVQSSAKYVRYVASITKGTAELSTVGRTVDGTRAADSLSMALDAANNMPLSVRFTDAPLSEKGALLPADCKGPFAFTASVNNTILCTIDTYGYGSIVVQSLGAFAGAVTAYTSNDMNNWVAQYGISGTGGIGTLTIGGAIFSYPAQGRYFRLQTTTFTSGKADVVVYLRGGNPTNTISSMSTSFNSVNGYGIPQEDVAYSTNIAARPGPLPIGGIASTPTSAPLTIALADSVRAAFTRQGALHTQEALYNQSDVPEYKKLLAQQLGNMPALPVILTGRDHENQPNDIFLQILTELKILNQQIFDLPRVLKSGIEAVDTPEQYRQDSTFFNS